MSEISDPKKRRQIKADGTSSIHIEAKKTKPDAAIKAGTSALSEEDEALIRNPNADLKSFHSSCEYLKVAIKNIKELKKTQSKESLSEISTLHTDVAVHFVHMKKLNRLAHFRCRKVRESTNEAKQKIDQCHLQLQNLLYEAMHLQKEITKCMEFKSKDEEIELVPLEQFYSDAPESISDPSVTRSDPHLQMLARLEWELEQRKQLATTLKETKSSKETISSEIQSKQDYLDTLQPKLTSILQATRPVQDYLDLPYDAIKEEHTKAEQLPMPLYILYMQTSAYKDACDKYLKVSIQGDMDAAKSVKTSMMYPVELDDDSDSDGEENEKDSKRRRKTVEARQVEKKSRVLRKHPLNVILNITDEDETDLQLTFNYLMALNIVTVNVIVKPGPKVTSSSISGSEVLSSEFFLDELYKGDNGNDSPNVANHFELKRHGLQEFSHYLGQVGRPYCWAQWMGGLQFLQPEAQIQAIDTSDSSMARLASVRARHSVAQGHMQDTVRRLRDRMAARMALMHQLTSLERSIIPVPADAARLFPTKINSQLASWKRSTYEDLKILDHAQRFIKAGLIKANDLVFVAVANRASAKLIAHVVLTADCPETAPLFIVEVKWQSQRTALTDVHILELEEEVNLHFSELLVAAGCRAGLLSCQMQRLLMCLDVYLETDTPASSAVPVEIPQEKMMPRNSRGRARSKPYKFVPELGIFTHRN